MFNAKEDELFNLDLDPNVNQFQISRLDKIQRKIHRALIDAERLLSELKPTVILMNSYRSIAVFLFYVVLILSGFYFMPIVAGVIVLLYVFTQVFGIFEAYTRIERIKNLLKRH